MTPLGKTIESWEQFTFFYQFITDLQTELVPWLSLYLSLEVWIRYGTVCFYFPRG